jgi:hypothetical protein
MRRLFSLHRGSAVGVGNGQENRIASKKKFALRANPKLTFRQPTAPRAGLENAFRGSAKNEREPLPERFLTKVSRS